MALEKSKPNVSFCLFYACNSSPMLNVLFDPNKVDMEINCHARKYILDSVMFDVPARTIHLPELFRTYWADFGNAQKDVLKYIQMNAGSKFSAKLTAYFAAIPTGKSRTNFLSYDWTPVIAFSD